MKKFLEDLFKTKAQKEQEIALARELERERVLEAKRVEEAAVLQRQKEMEDYFEKRMEAKRKEEEHAALQKLKEEEDKKARHKEMMDIYREEMKKSPEPWVEMVNGEIDPEHGIQIKLDWNDAFIVYLRQNGYTGEEEDALVQKWLIGINMSIANDKATEKFD